MDENFFRSNLFTSLFIFFFATFPLAIFANFEVDLASSDIHKSGLAAVNCHASVFTK